jgi:hypothetical protein
MIYYINQSSQSVLPEMNRTIITSRYESMVVVLLISHETNNSLMVVFVDLRHIVFDFLGIHIIETKGTTSCGGYTYQDIRHVYNKFISPEE